MEGSSIPNLIARIETSEYIKNFKDKGKTILKEFPMWDIATTFYQALHLVDSILILENGERPENHKDRNDLLQAKFPDIYRIYYTIFELSIVARYKPELLGDNEEDFIQNEFLDFYKQWNMVYQKYSFE